jgi:O-antigen/teichoic acid export membrane protein
VIDLSYERKQSLLLRIIRGVGANAFSQIVTILIQLTSLPLFLHYWDASTYGSWLLLSALPAYLSISDFGMVGAANNKMTMAIGRKDLTEANNVFQSAQLFLTTVCGSLAAIMTLAILFIPMPGVMSMDKRVALLALSWGILFGQFGGLSDAAFFATGRYATATMLGQTVRVAEWAGWIIGLILFRSFAGVALTGLFANVAGTTLRFYLSQRGNHGLRLGFRQASKAELLSMLMPAASFLGYTLSSALNFQGMTLLVGALAGTVAVVLFNAYRTIARVAVQLTSMFSHALWPEFARLFGQAGMGGVRSLFHRSALLSGAQSVGLSLLMYFISPWLLQIWTHGRIEFRPSTMAWLLAYAAVCGVWHVPRVLLMATNQHISLASWSLAGAILSIALGWLFGMVWQVNGISAAMLISESFMAIICAFIVYLKFAKADPRTGR